MSEKKRGEMPVRPPLDSISEAHVTGETRAANQSSTTIEIAELDSKEIQPGYYQHLVNVASKLKFSTVSDMKRFMFENHLEIQQLRSRYNGSQSTLPASESAAGPANRSFQPRPNNVYPDLPTSDAAEHRPPHSRASGLWSKHHELGSSTPAATSSHSSVPLQERPKPRSPGQYTIYRPIKKKTMNRNMETEGFTHGRYSEEMLHSASYASDRRSLSQAEEEPHHEWEDSPSVYSQNSQYSPGEQEEQWYQGPDRSSPEHSVYEDYLPQQKSSDAPYQSRRSSPGQAYDRFWSPPETPSRLQPREYGSHQDAYQPTSPRGSQVPLPPPYLSEWDTQMIRLQQQHRPYQPHFPRRNASWAPLPQRVRRDRIPGVLVHGPGGYQLASEARGIASFNPETYQPLPWEEGFGRRASTENRQSGGSGLQRLARFVTGSDRSGGQDRNSGSAGSEKDRPRRSGLRGKLKDMVDKTKRIIR